MCGIRWGCIIELVKGKSDKALIQTLTKGVKMTNKTIAAIENLNTIGKVLDVKFQETEIGKFMILVKGTKTNGYIVIRVVDNQPETVMETYEAHDFYGIKA